MEEWIVKARLRGGFLIVGQSAIETAAPPMVSGLAGMEISPVFDNDNKTTGEHDLSAVLQIQKTPGAKAPGRLVNDRVSDLLAEICSLLSLGCGQRVQTIGRFSATMRLSQEADEFRQIYGNADYAEIVAPVPLQQSLLTTTLDSKTRRIIAWWSRGLPPGNPADRLISLNNALDMLANSKKLGKPSFRECRKCKDRQDRKPSTRENFLALLDQQGVSATNAGEVWDTRIKLAHGSGGLGIEDERIYDKHCAVLLRVIRDVLARDLDVQLPDPQDTRFHGRSIVLDITFRSASLASEWHEWRHKPLAAIVQAGGAPPG